MTGSGRAGLGVARVVKVSRSMKLAGLLIAAPWALVVAEVSRAQAEPVPSVEEWTIERVEREVPIGGSLPIEIENPLGDLRIRVGDDDRVVVIAAVQRHRDDPERERLILEAGPERVRVGAEFAPVEATRSPAWSRRRIDLAVAVPRSARVVARTVDGLVEVKGHAGELDIETAAGEIRLWIAGSPRVRTGSGEIAAYLTAPGWSRVATFESSTGDILVSFPPQAAADVVLESRGAFATHFSVEVEKLGPERRRGRARLGAGGPEVRLTSRTGELRILEHLGPGSPPAR